MPTFSLFQQNVVGKELVALEVPPNFIGGWCYLVQTTAVRTIGTLLDRKFRIGFWEDVDLSWRLAAQNYKIGFLSNIYLHHYGHASFDNGQQKRSDHAISVQNGLYFAEKWDEHITAFLRNKMRAGMSLKEICTQYFIFAVYFGKERDDWTSLESKIRQTVFRGRCSFRAFLQLYVTISI